MFKDFHFLIMNVQYRWLTIVSNRCIAYSVGWHAYFGSVLSLGAKDIRFETNKYEEIQCLGLCTRECFFFFFVWLAQSAKREGVKCPKQNCKHWSPRDNSDEYSILKAGCKRKALREIALTIAAQRTHPPTHI